MVYHDHARAEAGLQLVEDGTNIRIIAQAQENIFSAESCGRRVLCDLALVLGGPIQALGLCPVPDSHLMALGRQMPRHMEAHHPQAKKRRFRHARSPCVLRTQLD